MPRILEAARGLGMRTPVLCCRRSGFRWPAVIAAYLPYIAGNANQIFAGVCRARMVAAEMVGLLQRI